LSSGMHRNASAALPRRLGWMDAILWKNAIGEARTPVSLAADPYPSAASEIAQTMQLLHGALEISQVFVPLTCRAAPGDVVPAAPIDLVSAAPHLQAEAGEWEFPRAAAGTAAACIDPPSSRPRSRRLHLDTHRVHHLRDARGKSSQLNG
jgi:hypothetical protein